MKVVILAGGYGTRISEESEYRPKPMLEIGGMPIIWHIMKLYSYYGFNEFIICAGYKQHIIKEWFANYYLYTSDITFDFEANNKMLVHNASAEPWKVTVVDTGLDTMTGGRIKRIADYINNEPFFLTYGDGVSDLNLKELLEFHKSRGKIATLSSAILNQRFGILDLDKNNNVIKFKEKMDSEENRINIGFMVLEPQIFKYLQDDKTVLEKETLELLAAEGELQAYNHKGFWQCMDTKREKTLLEKMWASGNAPWKVWKD